MFGDCHSRAIVCGRLGGSNTDISVIVFSLFVYLDFLHVWIPTEEPNLNVKIRILDLTLSNFGKSEPIFSPDRP